MFDKPTPGKETEMSYILFFFSIYDTLLILRLNGICFSKLC